MASSFDVKLQKIAELSGRVQKYQGRLDLDDTSIADLEKGIRDYESRLQDAKAARTRHANKLSTLKKEVKKLAAGLNSASNAPENAGPDTPMSDGGGKSQLDSSRRTTFGSTSSTARTSVSFTTRTPKPRLPEYTTSIHEQYPTVIKYQGKWHEITCHECGCNSNKTTGNFMTGLAGMRNHYMQSHKAVGPGSLDIVRCCTLRPVSDFDVDLLQQGLPAYEHPIEIRMQQEPPGVASKQNTSTTSSQQTTRVARKRDLPATSKQDVQDLMYPDYPTVIVLSGTAFELTCKECGTNAHGEDTSRFLKGVRGFKGHYALMHSEGVRKLSLEEFCDLRPISAHDQDLLELRMPPTDHPIVTIEAREEEDLEEDAAEEKEEKKESIPAVLRPQIRKPVGIAVDGQESEAGTTKRFAAPVARMSAPAEVDDDVDMKGLFTESEGE